MIIIIIIIFLLLLMSDFFNAVQGTDYDAPPLDRPSIQSNPMFILPPSYAWLYSWTSKLNSLIAFQN